MLSAHPNGSASPEKADGSAAAAVSTQFLLSLGASSICFSSFFTDDKGAVGVPFPVVLLRIPK